MPPLHRDSKQQQQQMSNVEQQQFDVKYKVLLLGDTLVGKTSLQRFIADRDFRTDIGCTVGVDFINKIIAVEKLKINLQIWDTAGQKNFRTIGKAHFGLSKAFVLVYDVTNIETFNLIEQFNQSIEQAGLDLEHRYLVANKIDLSEERKIDEETGQRFASRNSMKYFETSAKTGENIKEFIETIASDLVGRHDPKLLESHLPARSFVFNYSVPPETNGVNIIQVNQNKLSNGKGHKKKEKCSIKTSFIISIIVIIIII